MVASLAFAPMNRFLLSPKAFVLMISTAAGVSLVSCGKGSHETMPMAGTIQAESPEARALYEAGKAQEAAGQLGKAAKTYNEVYKRHPFSTHASDALYQRATLQQRDGELFEAFETYQTFINRYSANSKYSAALTQQAKVAHAAADGHITNNFIGLKTRIDPVKTETMLSKVISNAPRSSSAPKAAFAIGELWEKRGDARRAMTAYEAVVKDYSLSSYAPEAQFRIGTLLNKQAENGNQDQANLMSARQAFQDLLNLYPNSKRAPEARKQLNALSQQEVGSSLKIARFYEAKGQLDSAKFYYREVINKTKSGPLYDQAKARLVALGE